MNPTNQKYKLIKEIGKGSFGNVYLAEDTTNNRKVAIKRIEKKKIVKNTYLHQAFWKEIEIMKICNCKNSVEFIELLQTQNNYNVVMELCDSDLHNYLYSRSSGFSTEEIRNIMIQLNNVFKIMHSKNIMHRDLKLKNIMIKFPNINDRNNYEVKLCDYGFSKALDDSLVTSTHLGTPATMAPEVIADKAYTCQADLWSLGIIIYQLMFKDLPYLGFNEKQVLQKILARNPIKQPQDPLLKDLLNKLLTVEPEKRISWDQYFIHPFFHQYNNDNKNINNKVDNVKTNKGNVQEKNNNNSLGFIITKEFSYGINLTNLKIFIGKIINSNTLVYIKQFPLDFFNKHKKEIQNEINISNLFKDIPYSLQYHSTEYDDRNAYMLFNYIEGQSLKEYCKNNEISEVTIQKMNHDFYENVIIFIDVNIIQFNILSLYNFLVNKKGELILFDYGLIYYLLPEDIKSQYFIYSPTESNKKNIKSNILNYGITLFKLYYKDEVNIEINDKAINIPSSKPMSRDFISFISKCIYRNIDKRYSWNSFPLDNFVYSISGNDKSELLNKNQLNIIINGLEYRFKFISEYYSSVDFNDENNKKFIKEIGLFLMISFIELKTIKNILTKLSEKKNDFTKEEEISFVEIKKDSTYDFVTYNLGSIPKNKLIYRKDEDIKLDSFLNNIKIILKSILKICVKIRKIDKQACILTENTNSFIKRLLESFHQSKILNYFYHITQEGINYFDSKNTLSNQKLTIAEFLCEYIIFMKAFSSDNIRNINNFDLINKFFESKDEICISTVLCKEEKEKYLFVSFLGGMFRYYFNQLNNEENESESIVKKSEQAFDGLIQFYPSLMKLVIESK